mmetsp:Transcript_6897/g.11278  ORF Transcript_6897/g.11278 Transcript_6897/m.11278 type:complete len:229 (+) Transcript_6897:799-1485(+)
MDFHRVHNACSTKLLPVAYKFLISAIPLVIVLIFTVFISRGWCCKHKSVGNRRIIVNVHISGVCDCAGFHHSSFSPHGPHSSIGFISLYRQLDTDAPLEADTFQQSDTVISQGSLLSLLLFPITLSLIVNPFRKSSEDCIGFTFVCLGFRQLRHPSMSIVHLKLLQLFKLLHPSNVELILFSSIFLDTDRLGYLIFISTTLPFIVNVIQIGHLCIGEFATFTQRVQKA